MSCIAPPSIRDPITLAATGRFPGGIDAAQIASLGGDRALVVATTGGEIADPPPGGDLGVGWWTIVDLATGDVAPWSPALGEMSDVRLQALGNGVVAMSVSLGLSVRRRCGIWGSSMIVKDVVNRRLPSGEL